MKMVKVKEVIDAYTYCGMCIKTRSKDFGEHWYLIIKCPAKYFVDKVKFAKLSTGDVMDWDSMKDDKVLKTVSVENFHKMQP